MDLLSSTNAACIDKPIQQIAWGTQIDQPNNTMITYFLWLLTTVQEKSVYMM